jgi:hypothetical protein
MSLSPVWFCLPLIALLNLEDATLVAFLVLGFVGVSRVRREL